MSKLTIKNKSIALATECERLARECERQMHNPELSERGRLDYTDRAKVYWQMAQSHTQTALHAEEARPQKFTGGKAQGPRKATLDKQEFLRSVAAFIKTENREAIAAQAIAKHSGKVRKLWRAEGEVARRKILNFIRNNGLA